MTDTFTLAWTFIKLLLGLLILVFAYYSILDATRPRDGDK